MVSLFSSKRLLETIKFKLPVSSSMVINTVPLAVFGRWRFVISPLVFNSSLEEEGFLFL